MHDAVGNLYVAAIQGVPAGTDMWKSIDGGNTFTYIGEPDGTQAAAALGGGTGVGIGGGDEDLGVGSNGNLYLASLWLGSVMPPGGRSVPSAPALPKSGRDTNNFAVVTDTRDARVLQSSRSERSP